MIYNDTIVALATPSGAGAVAIIRMSGKDSITIASNVFQSVSGKDISILGGYASFDKFLSNCGK